MDDIYLVEIRLARTKWRIKRIITSIADYFHLEDHIERHPHVTIFGPLVLKPDTPEPQFLDILGSIASRFEPVPFIVGPLEKREGMHGSVIAFSVRPSEPLASLTKTVAQALLPVTESMNVWDPQPEKKWFHVTVANRLDPGIAADAFTRLTDPKTARNAPVLHPDLWTRLKSRVTGFIGSQVPSGDPGFLDDTGLRLTVMKGEHILAEYDFADKTWIRTDHDHKSGSWQKTLRMFRLQSGFELTSPVAPDPADIFVVSDLHLGHANIIRYCSRPFLFSDVDEMNFVIINNWNHCVSPQNQVFHLGDLRYGRGSQEVDYYRRQLAGRITFIEGNHDDRQLNTIRNTILEYDGIRFLLVHDPADIPASFDGWVIHGHHHNNDLTHYPFMNFLDRRINVSAEVVGYCPVSMQEICTHIHTRQESGNTAPIILRYPYHSG